LLCIRIPNNAMGCPTPPFFIVGASRSGTTLFRLMLCGNSRVFIPPEAWFFGDAICRLPAATPLDESALRKLESIILANSRWEDWECEASRLQDILADCAGLDLAATLDRLVRGVFALPASVTWGEKSPRHSHIVDRIAAVFPEAGFIHIVRDGRDSCASMMARGWYEGQMRRIAEHWATCYCAAGKAAHSGAGRYMELRFEDLLANAEREMQRVCEFLGLEFCPAMMEFGGRVDSLIPAGESGLHDKLRGPLAAAEVGKWKATLSPWQEAVFWAVAGDAMSSVDPASAPRPRAGFLLPAARLVVGAQAAFARLMARLRPPARIPSP
jgi:hypothetical protein